MGGFTCCVPGCKNNSTRDRHIRFYVFPKDPKLREIWVENIAKPGKSANSPFKPTNGYRVCSVHFEGGKKTYMINIPTIFPRNKRVELIKGNEERSTSSSTLDNIETESTGAGDDADTTDTSFLLNKIKEKEQLIQDLKERIFKLENEVICIKSRRLKKLAVDTSIIHT